MNTNSAPRGILHSSTEDEGGHPVSGAYGSKEEVMLCPWCGSSWSHLDQVDMLSASNGGMSLRSHGEDSSSRVTAGLTGSGGYRRHTAVLHFDCENCHGGTISLQQHKGNTFVSCEPKFPYLRGDRVTMRETKEGGVVTYITGTGRDYIVHVKTDDDEKIKFKANELWRGITHESTGNDRADREFAAARGLDK